MSSAGRDRKVKAKTGFPAGFGLSFILPIVQV
jgi:hypothetical protein